MKRLKLYSCKLDGWIACTALSFLTIFSAAPETSGQGTVTNIQFYSHSLETERNVQIYLPEGYSEQDSVRYPVIYFLHGATLNHTAYQNLITVLNTLIGESRISPVIVVKPDGSVGPWTGSFYTNSQLYGNFEDYIVNDLTEFIEDNYKTISSRNKRAVMGHSMGGYGAMKIALKHPDRYGAVASHSAPLDFSHWPDRIPGVVSENGGVPVSSYDPDKLQTRLFYTLAGAFSPNLNHTPYPVDFLIDSMGTVVDSVFSRWMLNDPASLAAEMDRSSHLSIYFDCGEEDELLTYPFNTGFAESLDKMGIDYDFRSFTGGHMNQLPTRLPIALQFLDSVMNRTEINAESGTWTYKAPMPTARTFLGTCVLDGKIYTMGGATSQNTFSSVLEVYDPITDTWTQEASMPMALCYPNVCSIDRKIYVFGGTTALFGGVVTKVYVYDPDTDRWTQIEDSPHEFGDAAIAAIDHKVYLISGTTVGNIPVPDVNEYNTLTGIWSPIADIPTARTGFSACVYEKKIYCFGGTNENWASVFYPNVEQYDPEQDSWVSKKDMPLGRWSPAVSVLDDLIFVSGGHNGSNACDRLDILDPVSDAWARGTPMQQSRRGHESCVLDGKIYVMGGSYSNNGMPVFLSSMEVYELTIPTGSMNDKTENRRPENYLRQNYPNPFASSTSIDFSLQSQQIVSLNMFDSLGRHVAVLVNEIKQPGEYTVTFHSGDLTDGIYFFRLEAGNYIQTNKCVLLRQY